ncbi:hypothetical protein C7451_11691 [Blastomonas natatoria]|uniref:Uncharacterized protein n=1 Tax=Blastomonas natatoria TaxID=34015 RepID=A0A2V3URK2_9SPHN|nr:hypothetical protein C7451_11691 [Blastomonas natatoria]
MSANATDIFKQTLTINAMGQAMHSMSAATGAGNVDVYAQTRADIQTERTYGSIASNAMKWGRAQSNHGGLGFTLTFPPDLNVEPSEQRAIARCDCMVAFINHDDARFCQPRQVSNFQTRIQSLDTGDNNNRFIALRRSRITLSAPKPDNTKIFAGGTDVHPQLTEALHCLLTQLVGLRHP